MSKEQKDTAQETEISSQTTPLELVTHIINENSEIEGVSYWTYHYVPLQIDEKEMNKLHWTPKEEFLDSTFIDNFYKTYPPQIQLAISSLVETKDGLKHIPMMDFDILKGEEGLEILLRRLYKSQISEGWILETGRSYHYYGQNLLTEDEWLDFLARCLLTSEVRSRDNIVQVADTRYIGHALRRRDCSLRLTTRDDKTFIPRVIYDLKNNKDLRKSK